MVFAQYWQHGSEQAAQCMRQETHWDVVLLAEGDGCLIHDPQVCAGDIFVAELLVKLCTRVLQHTEHVAGSVPS